MFGEMLLVFRVMEKPSLTCCPCSPPTTGMAGGKYRSFLVHIKAISDRGVEESPRPVLRMPSAKPQGTKAHSLSTLLQRAQASKVHCQQLGNIYDIILISLYYTDVSLCLHTAEGTRKTKVTNGLQSSGCWSSFPTCPVFINMF